MVYRRTPVEMVPSIHRMLLQRLADDKTRSKRQRRNPLLQAAAQAYGGEIAPAGYQLVRQTPTVRIYENLANPRRVIIGVRGSQDARDWRANAQLSVGLLKNSARYKDDARIVGDYLRANPRARAQVSGHSLGGAIARQLTRDYSSQILGGEGYNAAVGLDEVLSSKKLRAGKQQRYSTPADILHAVSSPLLAQADKPQEVNAGPFGRNPLTAHAINRFDATQLGVN